MDHTLAQIIDALTEAHEANARLALALEGTQAELAQVRKMLVTTLNVDDVDRGMTITEGADNGEYVDSIGAGGLPGRDD